MIQVPCAYHVKIFYIEVNVNILVLASILVLEALH